MNGIILWKVVIIILVFGNVSDSRKIKRTGAHISNIRHVNPHTGIAAEPYKYETIHVEEFSYAQPQSPSQSPPQSQSQSQSQQILQYGYEGSQHSIGSSTYLIDNGLRNIAKGSANQASTAVASQNAAAKQAAYVAKSTLAQTANQAANTALAVLKGKEALLQKLIEHHSEAYKALQNELAQLQQAKRSAKAAQLATEQALNHVSILMAALNNAQSASQLAEKSASEAALELASQIDMVAQAKSKLEQLESQLYAARLDYEETKQEAQKASHLAQEAQNNANDAGVHANIELNGSVHTSPHTFDKRASEK